MIYVSVISCVGDGDERLYRLAYGTTDRYLAVLM